jgi:hypothetical protein
MHFLLSLREALIPDTYSSFWARDLRQPCSQKRLEAVDRRLVHPMAPQVLLRVVFIVGVQKLWLALGLFCES